HTHTIPSLHPFPTRRSSDLIPIPIVFQTPLRNQNGFQKYLKPFIKKPRGDMRVIDQILTSVLTLILIRSYINWIFFMRHELMKIDRKSTRLNSSHLGISYAV